MKIFYLLCALIAFHLNRAQVNLYSNLKVCLPFSGNANDMTGNGHNGFVSGSVTLTSDRFNNSNSAYKFIGGTNDYIAINTFSAIAPNNELSFSIWAKADINTSTCLFMLNPDNSSDRCVGCAQYSGVGLIWDYGNIGNQGRLVKSAPFDTLWHHYVYSLSQSGNTKEIYMDGVLQNSGPYGSLLVNKNFPLYIGAGTSSVGGGSLRWRGKIDDIMIYNRALTSNEVLALRNNTITCTQNTVELNELSEELKRNCFYPTISDNGVFYYRGNLRNVQVVEVYSIEGKLLQTNHAAKNGNDLNLTTLSNGIYLIKTKLGGENTFQKIIIERK